MPHPRTKLPWWMRLSLRVSATSAGTWLLSRTLPQFDRFLKRVSGGRLTLPRVMSAVGAPIVKLTTTGAKTGTERNVPVLGLKDGERWIVVASNWGREEHPAWYHNLKANPEVKLTFKNQTGQYVAQELTGEEREAYWNRIKDVNPSLDTYQQRAGDRQIPIVALTPKEGNSDPVG